MKKIYTIASFLTLAVTVQAQTAFWSEDFGNGCDRGQTPAQFASVNGAWTETSTGTNDSHADMWFVSATAAGTGGGNCSDNCQFVNTTNRSLHIGNAAVVIPSVISIGADTGSTYLTGAYCGFSICSTTNKRVESPVINCLGKSNIVIAFTYYEGGELGGDEATLWFSPDAGTTWQQIDVLPKTTVGPCTAPSATWFEYSVNLPASANNNGNVKFAFHWTNDNDANGGDPSFAVDDIALLEAPSAVTETNSAAFEIFSAGNGQVRIVPNGSTYKVLGVYDMLGRDVSFTRAENTLQLGETVPGIYIINVEVNGERVVKRVLMN